MALDVDELKLRIERGREASAAAPNPRDAQAREEDVASTLTPAKAGLLGKLYGLPVVGYAVRIVASVFNLPRIVQNLARHYSAYHSEIRRLNSQVVELKHHAGLAEQAAAQSAAQIARLQRRLDELEARAPGPNAGGTP